MFTRGRGNMNIEQLVRRLSHLQHFFQIAKSPSKSLEMSAFFTPHIVRTGGTTDARLRAISDRTDDEGGGGGMLCISSFASECERALSSSWAQHCVR